MKKTGMRLLSWLLCAAMMVGMLAGLPAPSAAAEGNPRAATPGWSADGLVFTDDFNSYEDHAELVASQKYSQTFVTGEICTEEGTHGQYLRANAADAKLLEIPANHVDKVLTFDMRFEETFDFGGWGGVFAKAYRVNDSGKETYAVLSGGTDITNGIRLSSNVESGGFASADAGNAMTYSTNTWYKVEMTLEGQTLTTKVWPENGSKENAKVVTGTTQLSMDAENSCVWLELSRGGLSGTDEWVNFDNVSVELLNKEPVVTPEEPAVPGWSADGLVFTDDFNSYADHDALEASDLYSAVFVDGVVEFENEAHGMVLRAPLNDDKWLDIPVDHVDKVLTYDMKFEEGFNDASYAGMYGKVYLHEANGVKTEAYSVISDAASFKGARLTFAMEENGTNKAYQEKYAESSYTYTDNQWYKVEIRFEKGTMTFKIWPENGSKDQALVVSETTTMELPAEGSIVRLELTPGGNTEEALRKKTVSIDNVSIELLNKESAADPDEPAVPGWSADGLVFTDDFNSYADYAALQGSSLYNTVFASGSLTDGGEDHGKVLTAPANDSSQVEIPVGHVDKVLTFDMRLEDGFNVGKWAGVYAKVYRKNDPKTEAYAILSGGSAITNGIRLTSNYNETEGNGFAFADADNAMTYTTNTWYKVKVILEGQTVTTKIWPENGGSEATAKVVTGTTQLSMTAEDSCVWLELSPGSTGGGNISLDNVSIELLNKQSSEPDQDGMSFTEDFEAYDDHADLVASGKYSRTFVTGKIDTADGHGKILTANAADADLLEIPVGHVDKVLTFDMRLADTFDFGGWGGVFAKAYYNGGKETYAVFSNGTGIVNGMRLSSNYNTSEENGFASADAGNAMAYERNAWYKVKLILEGQKLTAKVWPENGGSEATAKVVTGTTSMPMTGEGSTVWLELSRGGLSGTDEWVSFDNISISTEKAAVTVRSSNPDKGTVSGSGNRLIGGDATVKAVAKAGYEFDRWTDAEGNTVSEEAAYTFTVGENGADLTAVFKELTPEILSFMATGMTGPAVFDEANKLITVRFAADIDLSQVRPYFYVKNDPGTGLAPYTTVDLSNGKTVELVDGWKVQAVQNTVMRHIYVDSVNGSDSNDGSSPAKAFKTIEAAQAAVRAIENWSGDVFVNLADGTYVLNETLKFTQEDSAESGCAVIYRSLSGDASKVILSGGRKVTGWTDSDNDGIWEASAEGIAYSRDLFVDGTKATLARSGYLSGWSYNDSICGYNTSGTYANISGWHDVDNIEFVYESKWTYNVMPVVSADNGHVYLLESAYKSSLLKSASHHASDTEYYLQNARELLDEAGEWYFDESGKTIYYKPAAGKNPNTLDIVVPVLDQLITVNGVGGNSVAGLGFQDLTFEYTSYFRPHVIGQVERQANFLVDPELANEPTIIHNQYLKTPAGVEVNYATGLRIAGCTFRRFSSGGLDLALGVRNATITGNTFTKIGATGIQMGGTDVRDAHPEGPVAYHNNQIISVSADPWRTTEQILVFSNDICNVGVDYQGSIGVFAGYGRDITIAHNTISDLPYSGISIGWGWGYWDKGGRPGNDQWENAYYDFQTDSVMARYVVEGNHITNIMQRLYDGGAIYTLGLMPGSIIRANYMKDVKERFGNIYNDEGAGGFVAIEDNICAGQLYDPYFYHNPTGNFYADRKQACYDLIRGNNFFNEPDPPAYNDNSGYNGTAMDASVDPQYEIVKQAAGTKAVPYALKDLGTDPALNPSDVVEALIAALPAEADVTLDDEANIKAARTAYDALTDEQEALVSADAKIKLAAAETALAALKQAAANQAAAKAVEDQIAALPAEEDMSLDDENAIAAAREAYDALTDVQKALVDNLSTLANAERKLAQLKKAAADQEAADEVEALIEAIGEVTLEDEEAIEEAEEAYAALTPDQKNLVENADDLVAARTEYNALKAAADKAAADQEAADAVEDLIDALPAAEDVSLDDEDAIEEAEEAYAALTPDQKNLVENDDKLAAVRAAYDVLKAAADKAAADEAAAAGVEELIEKIGTVTLNSKADIDAARAAYDDLTEDQKALVDNYDDLTDAEDKYEELVEDAAQDEIDAAAAAGVEDLIEKIGTVTLNSKTDIEAARAAYDKLTPAQKALVENYDDLTDAEAKYEELAGEAGQEAADKVAAEAVEDLIEAIGAVTLGDKKAIEAARTAYDALTDAQKALVGNYAKLTAAEAELKELIEDAFLTGSLILSGASNPFKDIKNHWAKDAIGYVYAKGLMNGVEDDKFAPDATLTRAMVVTILYRLSGEPVTFGTAPFSDVESGSWYGKAVLWASKNNIVNGMGDGTFAPMQNITREQFASILYRYAQYRGERTGAKANLNGYKDAGQISGWATEAMAWAAAEGLINGRTAATIAPKGTATRAEAATILMRFCKNF